jgi:3-methyladenine DNA glycosylase AlkD
MNIAEVLGRLNNLADPDKVTFKEMKFGIQTNNSLGIYHKDLNGLAKEIGKDTELGIQLFDTGVYEARILCSKICRPKELSEELLDIWVETFDTWEICDSFCMGLFKYNEVAIKKAFQWSLREEEFVKRAGLVLMAVYGFADKHADNSVFESFLPVLIRESNDDRIYVKKAVNWALRQIGKRNQDLRLKATETAKIILQLESKSAQWIAKDALRELKSENLNVLDYPRSIYRS